MDLREKILSDTKKYKYIAVKRLDARLFGGADPDAKLLCMDFSISYDGRNWETYQDYISVEGERISSKKGVDERARKYLKSVVKSVEKSGVKNVKYAEDKYVFHR